MMILIAGPYRSGTGDDPALMAANLAPAGGGGVADLPAGHVPMIGEWVALPVLRSAGEPGRSARSREQVMYPTAQRLLAALRRRPAARRASRRAPTRTSRSRKNADCRCTTTWTEIPARAS